MKTLAWTFQSCLILGLASLLGCGPSGSSSHNSGPQIYTYKNLSELDQAVADFSLSCEGSCPDSAGALMIKNGTELDTCSFSLVDSQTIMTARHCLPDSVASVGASCNGVIQALFKNNSGTTDVYDCDRVVSFAQDWKMNSITRDFAFLKLTKVPAHKPLKIDTSGVQDQEVLTALTATPDHSSAKPRSVMIQKKCTVLMNSMINKTFTNGHKPTMAFKDCDIVPGNSGSVMIGANGQAKADIQAMITESENPLLSFSGMQQRYQEILAQGHFAIATNAACMEEPDLGLSPGTSGCDQGQDTYGLDKMLNRDLVKKTLLDVQTQLNTESSIFGFQANTVKPTASEQSASGSLLTIKVDPSCIQGSPKNIPWISQYKNKGIESFLHKYVEQDTLDLKLPHVRFYLDFDENARAVLKSEETSVDMQVTLPIREIADHGAEGVVIQGASWMTVGNTAINVPALYKLKFCSETAASEQAHP